MSRQLGWIGTRIAAALLLVPLGAACGDGDDDDHSHQSVTKTCCLNDAFWECSESAVMCTEPNHTCVRMPSRDDECR